jgi:adenylate kinase
VEYNKPKVDDVCDNDGTPLASREDDNPETVRARLKIFRGETMPVINCYRERGLLIEVPAAGKVAEVDQTLAAVMEPFKRQQ